MGIGKNVLYIVLFLFLVLFLGTGQFLASRGGREQLWQFFLFGFIIWLWGFIILVRTKDLEEEKAEGKLIKDPTLWTQKEELEKLKMAAISGLLSITFFFASISWIFKEDVLISSLILVVTFMVSMFLQNRLLQKQREREEEEL